MGEPWDIPNADSEPGKSKWLVKGNLEEMPHISDSNYHAGTTLSPPMCLSTCTLFLLITLHLFHYFPSLWGFFSAKPQGQALVADHWSSGWDSVLSPPRPDLNHWPKTETLLQVTAGRGHRRSIWVQTGSHKHLRGQVVRPRPRTVTKLA